jgi:hypothetical protein
MIPLALKPEQEQRRQEVLEAGLNTLRPIHPQRTRFVLPEHPPPPPAGPAEAARRAIEEFEKASQRKSPASGLER